MNRIFQFLSIAFLFVLVFNSCNKKEEKVQESKIISGAIWKDNNGVPINAHGGGMLYHDGVYYWYGEHKVEGLVGNTAQVGFHCYSSTNLYDWNDEGIVLRVVEDDPDHDIAKGVIMERPKVIYNQKTKKFVMWFHLEPKGVMYDGAKTAIAIADSPTGNFKYVRSMRPNAGHMPLNAGDLIEKPIHPVALSYRFGGSAIPFSTDSLNLVKRDFKNGQMSRDQTLFVDDDGTAYHIHASEENATLHISKLTDDYTDTTGEYVRVFPDRFMEAPAIFKKDGKYYLIASGCTGWAPNASRSAVAENIFGPWQELSNPFKGELAYISYDSQGNYVLPIAGKKDAFMYMGDRWNPTNPIDGRYVWLPIKFDIDGYPYVDYLPEWDFSEYEK
ncbi:glycosyl hydrolase family 43 [Jejuia pallidilutea]|uniref:Glycosyl hydrolase family 43 n=1 Tax=Jejuia pallidilutea TaxID=504487 RepID=A0A362X3L3_9FLAO|nr:glycoside hydrolase family 43 protein [Jejuia pallidilutea]PQV51485.1 glycosyl hydrolase family 43 [Jejuia pallidilutea]